MQATLIYTINGTASQSDIEKDMESGMNWVEIVCYFFDYGIDIYKLPAQVKLHLGACVSKFLIKTHLD